jgi:phosphatidylserine/phosphatidylglycerophosphate/cardiolipin synthase-like enzyme
MTTDTSSRRRRTDARMQHNREFFDRLRQRHPSARESLDRAAKELEADLAKPLAEGVAATEAPARGLEELALETIVRRERPVLFVQDDWINKVEVTIDGIEAQDLIDRVEANRAIIAPAIPLIGRIDVTHFPGSDYVGTGWFIGPDIVVTNRHVASLVARWDGRQFVFRRGVASRVIESSVSTAHEFDDVALEPSRSFPITAVLYIEPENGPDIAFVRVRRKPDASRPTHIEVSASDAGDNVPVLVVGYPARAPKSVIPDQDRMRELFRGRYDVKRAAPGYTMSPRNAATRHDCTTLGGNSGSVVLDLATGKALGLHFAGLYQESNYAVRASVLSRYIHEERWRQAPAIGVTSPEQRGGAPVAVAPSPSPAPQPPWTASSGTVATLADGTAAMTLPLTITVRLGLPSGGSAAAGQPPTPPQISIEQADSLLGDFWQQRPDGVVAARLGFEEKAGEIGDLLFIAASVPADQLTAVQAAAAKEFGGLGVRYFAADAAELLDRMPMVEAIERVSYDDGARQGQEFSFDTVEEQMVVRAHVGPEYSWAELDTFLKGAKRKLVSAMYEFHGAHIAEALAARLRANVSLELVLDNATFNKVRNADEEFDRVETFKKWAADGSFERIVAPEGSDGLIANSYHIKVTVRDDDTFWLSSGNWKMGSSQPPISDQQRDDATSVDLPGNREWHVVAKSPTLAKHFRSHIEQDFKRSKELGGGPVPARLEAIEAFVDIPVEPLEERRPPSKVLEPKVFRGRIRVKPLLTPDDGGAVYSEAVLDLIRGARESLLFQIPYIGMPSSPGADRGYIDELIRALTQKLKTLDDARVLLRTGGSNFSAPAHAAWYFKSRGVDIGRRVRQLSDHHTKGMIVDGRRVLLGSHNWSKPGVSLNRDASLLFEHEGIALYYGEAFEIDWARASRISPKKYVKPEGVAGAIGEAPPGYRRVAVADLAKDFD